MFCVQPCYAFYKCNHSEQHITQWIVADLCALFIADGPFKLYGEDAEYSDIAAEIEQQEGVITHGLFVGIATAAALVTPDGMDMFHTVASLEAMHQQK